MFDAEITYDPDALPNSLEVDTYNQTVANGQRLDLLSDSLRDLAASQDNTASDEVTSAVTLDAGQYGQLAYDIQATNTIAIMVLVLTGICTGLLAWRVFSGRWA